MTLLFFWRNIMSNTRITIGYMAELKIPRSEDDYSEICDRLYDMESNLALNYDCNLLFSTDFDDIAYEFTGIKFGLNQSVQEFIEEAKEHGLDVKEETVKPYTCLWYDGADSYMSTTTLEEFRE